jgi:hypothetical protein
LSPKSLIGKFTLSYKLSISGGKIAESLKRQVKHRLNEILKKHLDGVLSEMSIDRLLGDPRLRTDYT